MPTAGLVLNRTTPPPPDGVATDAAALDAAISRLTSDGGTEARTAAALLRLHADRVVVAAREAHNVTAALRGVDPRALVDVPEMPGDVHDVDTLAAVGAHLYG